MLDIATSYHCMQLEKMAKNLVLGLILAHLALIPAANFFSKIWLCQSLNVMVSYHHVQYQKKLMIQSCENLVTDRQTDRQGQVDKSDFIGHYLTNVEHPKRFLGKDTSHNDHYTLAGKGWRLMVFDRWPTLIFSATLISSKWCSLFLIVSG